MLQTPRSSQESSPAKREPTLLRGRSRLRSSSPLLKRNSAPPADVENGLPGRETGFYKFSGLAIHMGDDEVLQVIDTIRRDAVADFEFYPFDKIRKLTMNIDLTRLPVSMFFSL